MLRSKGKIPLPLGDERAGSGLEAVYGLAREVK